MVNLEEGCVHLSPDVTPGMHSDKNTINHEVRLSPNQSSNGSSRKSATSHDAQKNGEIQRRLQWYRTPDGTPGRHSIKSAVDHDDNVQTTLYLSPGQTSHVPSTHDVSHDECRSQDHIHDTGLRKLGKKHDISQSLKSLSRSHTPEGKSTIYCADEFVKCNMTNGTNTVTANMFNCSFDCYFFNEKEDIYFLHLREAHGFAKNIHVEQMVSCNQCEFTCVTKTDLAKHTSEVHENCEQSAHPDGKDENNTPVEALQKTFLCPFNCDFSNEDEDIFLIHLKIMDFQSELLIRRNTKHVIFVHSFVTWKMN